jgi:hypothetical protein
MRDVCLLLWIDPSPKQPVAAHQNIGVFKWTYRRTTSDLVGGNALETEDA